MTGVQTCALPISPGTRCAALDRPREGKSGHPALGGLPDHPSHVLRAQHAAGYGTVLQLGAYGKPRQNADIGAARYGGVLNGKPHDGRPLQYPEESRHARGRSLDVEPTHDMAVPVEDALERAASALPVKTDGIPAPAAQIEVGHQANPLTGIGIALIDGLGQGLHLGRRADDPGTLDRSVSRSEDSAALSSRTSPPERGLTDGPAALYSGLLGDHLDVSSLCG